MFPDLTNDKYGVLDTGTLNLLEEQFMNLQTRRNEENPGGGLGFYQKI